jgi:probable HAF family extracellular repeat protein
MLAATAFALAAGQGAYTAQDVLVGGRPADGWSLSNTGYVAGECDTPGNPSLRGFRWQNGSFQYLDGASTGQARYGAGAYAVNDTGVVVGDAGDEQNAVWVAMWDGSGYHNLGNLGGFNSNANSINNAAWLVGYSEIPGNAYYRPFLYRNGSMQNLGNLGIPGATYGNATRINNNGTVIGYDLKPGESNTYYAWYWTDSGGLQPLPAAFYDINDLDQVTASGGSYSLVTHATTQLPGCQYTKFLNNNGQALGFDTANVPCLWIGQNRYTLQSILPSGYVINGLRDINDQGQILVSADHNGVTQTVLLTPVPEPASIVILACGLAMAVQHRCSSSFRKAAWRS